MGTIVFSKNSLLYASSFITLISRYGKQELCIYTTMYCKWICVVFQALILLSVFIRIQGGNCSEKNHASLYSHHSQLQYANLELCLDRKNSTSITRFPYCYQWYCECGSSERTWILARSFLLKPGNYHKVADTVSDRSGKSELASDSVISSFSILGKSTVY